MATSKTFVEPISYKAATKKVHELAATSFSAVARAQDDQVVVNGDIVDSGYDRRTHAWALARS